jgi:hypothetical protein
MLALRLNKIENGVSVMYCFSLCIPFDLQYSLTWSFEHVSGIGSGSTDAWGRSECLVGTSVGGEKSA